MISISALNSFMQNTWPHEASFVTPRSSSGCAGLSITSAISSSVSIVAKGLRQIGHDESGGTSFHILYQSTWYYLPACPIASRSLSFSLGSEDTNDATALYGCDQHVCLREQWAAPDALFAGFRSPGHDRSQPPAVHCSQSFRHGIPRRSHDIAHAEGSRSSSHRSPVVTQIWRQSRAEWD